MCLRVLQNCIKIHLSEIFFQTCILKCCCWLVLFCKVKQSVDGIGTFIVQN